MTILEKNQQYWDELNALNKEIISSEKEYLKATKKHAYASMEGKNMTTYDYEFKKAHKRYISALLKMKEFIGLNMKVAYYGKSHN